MKLISWNINGIRACHKKGCFNWFFEYGPDILCLQETKATLEQIPDEIKAVSGYHTFFDAPKERKGYSGVAIFSKKAPQNVEYAMGNETLDREGRLIATYFDEWVLVNVYFPNGSRGPERLTFKLDFYNAFRSYLHQLRKKGLKVIFCGDLNTAHKEIDLARPKENEKNSGFLPVERAWIDTIVKLGYLDTFRLFYPEKRGAYTYWDQKSFARERNIGWRLDYFFVSPDLKDRLKSVHIFDSVLGSDHCPIELELSD